MDIQESIQCVLGAEPIFGKLFYDTLFERHPEVRGFFYDVDIDHQAVLLTMQLKVIGQCYLRDSPVVDSYLHFLGTRHKRKDIPRDSYLPFRDILIETLEGFLGPDWDENLAAQWGDAINTATLKMFKARGRGGQNSR